MWKIAVFVLIAIVVIADSIYLYSRLKKYWPGTRGPRQGPDGKKWKIGLPSLDIPVSGKADAEKRLPDKH